MVSASGRAGRVRGYNLGPQSISNGVSGRREWFWPLIVGLMGQWSSYFGKGDPLPIDGSKLGDFEESKLREVPPRIVVAGSADWWPIISRLC